jgi:hypothetical protein
MNRMEFRNITMLLALLSISNTLDLMIKSQGNLNSSLGLFNSKMDISLIFTKWKLPKIKIDGAFKDLIRNFRIDCLSQS